MPPGSRARAAAPGAALLLAAACVSTRTDGRVVLGDAAWPAGLAPSKCYSGARESFHGVDLVDPSSHALLRVALDPILGPRLRLVEAAGGEQRVTILGPEECAVLDVEVSPTAWRVNHVRDVSGHARFACRTAQGRALEADLRFEHCH